MAQAAQVLFLIARLCLVAAVAALAAFLEDRHQVRIAAYKANNGDSDVTVDPLPSLLVFGWVGIAMLFAVNTTYYDLATGVAGTTLAFRFLSMLPMLPLAVVGHRNVAIASTLAVLITSVFSPYLYGLVFVFGVADFVHIAVGAVVVGIAILPLLRGKTESEPADYPTTKYVTVCIVCAIIVALTYAVATVLNILG